MSMRCPDCANEMHAGTIRVKQLTLDPPPVELVLVADSGVEHVLAAETRAYWCDHCGAMTLRGAASETLACFECGNAIATDQERCELCGWSWK